MVGPRYHPAILVIEKATDRKNATSRKDDSAYRAVINANGNTAQVGALQLTYYSDNFTTQFVRLPRKYI